MINILLKPKRKDSILKMKNASFSQHNIFLYSTINLLISILFIFTIYLNLAFLLSDSIKYNLLSRYFKIDGQSFWLG